jgi:hypothetical protein
MGGEPQGAAPGNGQPESRESAPPAPPAERPSEAVPASPPPSAPAAQPGGSYKPPQTYTVWSSTPGEGHHFDPKE